MNRLTKKNNGTGSWTQIGDKYLPAHNIKHKQCVNKLGQLEDIEEEIGVDLIKAIEICKQVNSKKVVYIKDEYGIYPIKILDKLDIELFNHRLYKNVGGVYVSLDLYEYGKTWSLDKQTLEK